MALIIALGTNLGNREQNLMAAITLLNQRFNLQAQSKIYQSAAIEYTDQPDFFNMVLQFEKPDLAPDEIMRILLEFEIEMGRQRNIPKGPRVIDIDLLFYGLEKFENDTVIVPHPRLFQRSFVVRPLRELPFFQELQRHYDFATEFDVEAYPIAK